MNGNSFKEGTRVSFNRHYKPTNEKWLLMDHEDREATFRNSLRTEEQREGKPDYVEMVQTDDGGLHMVPVGDLVTGTK